jgi:hypothetical protein
MKDNIDVAHSNFGYAQYLIKVILTIALVTL